MKLGAGSLNRAPNAGTMCSPGADTGCIVLLREAIAPAACAPMVSEGALSDVAT